METAPKGLSATNQVSHSETSGRAEVLNVTKSKFQPSVTPVVLRSVDLKAVAAVSVLLYSGDEKLQVRGPIQISLPLGHNTHLRATDTVPAWAFNQNTGKNKGLMRGT